MSSLKTAGLTEILGREGDIGGVGKLGCGGTGRQKDFLQRQIGRSVAHGGGDETYPNDGKREAAPSDRRLDLWHPTRQGCFESDALNPML